MTKEALFLAFDAVDEEMVADAGAAAEKKKSPRLLRWGAVAACVCLLALGGMVLGPRLGPAAAPSDGGGVDAPGGGVDAPGGTLPEGVDPKMASISVYPATEQVQDVAEATLRSISEEEALRFGELGRYLPQTPPEGWWFVTSEVYETTMKNGRQYHLLRATYSRSDPAVFDPEKPYLTDDCFMLQVLDYLPDTKTIRIYTPEKLKLSERDRDDFYLALDSVYVGVFPQHSLEGEELRQVVEELMKK